MLFTDDTGCVPGPGKTSPSVYIGRADLDGASDFLFGRDLLYGACGTNTSAERAAPETGPNAIEEKNDEKEQSDKPGGLKGLIVISKNRRDHYLGAVIQEIKGLYVTLGHHTKDSSYGQTEARQQG